MNGLIPGDGMHIVYPLLLGVNRGRYFLLTGQSLSAQQALELGLVNEVLPRERLVDRAWELAEQLTRQSPLILRYSRVLLTQNLKRQMHDLLGYGLALEGLGSAQSRVDLE
jgi:enoyl-CoA hydratase/carnithine racemase